MKTHRRRRSEWRAHLPFIALLTTATVALTGLLIAYTRWNWLAWPAAALFLWQLLRYWRTVVIPARRQGFLPDGQQQR